MLTAEYCREIESYLCRKNDGHLIRVVGPSFDLVSGWAARGVPLKVAFQGIDRTFERYHRQGRRRRPLRIDYCDADVLDAFDDWRRALGLPVAPVDPGPDGEAEEPSRERGSSLPAHLERVLLRLTTGRATGVLGAVFDGPIDRIASDLDAARRTPGGVRGDARRAMLQRLAAVDDDLLRAARSTLGAETAAELDREVDAELAPFRASMAPEAFGRARAAAADRLLRERLGLPTVAFR